VKGMKKEYRYYPRIGQLNPDLLETDKVQYWHKGVMLTNISKAAAQQMIRDGLAFVITSQAIGAMQDGYSIS